MIAKKKFTAISLYTFLSKSNWKINTFFAVEATNNGTWSTTPILKNIVPWVFSNFISPFASPFEERRDWRGYSLRLPDLALVVAKFKRKELFRKKKTNSKIKNKK